MKGMKFRITHPKLDVTDACIRELVTAWDAYIEMRVVYADALIKYNWSHQGGRQDENPHRRTEKMGAAYDDYFEAMDTFKRAHATYKTSVRELLRGKLL